MSFLLFTLIPGVASFFLMKKQKDALPEGKIDETPLSGNLFWYVLILNFVAPFLAQMIFYYGWKNRLPIKAKKANSLGWIAIIIWFGGFYLLAMR